MNHPDTNIDHFFSSPSVIDELPIVSRPGMRITSSVFQRILYDANQNKMMVVEKNDDDVNETIDSSEEINIDPIMLFDGQQTLVNILNRSRQEEVQHLSEVVLSQQPQNDRTAQFILSQLNLAPHSHRAVATLSAIAGHTTEQHTYSPIIQSGVVAQHHRPYAAYGHLDRTTIAKECQFNLEQPSTETHKRMRLNSKSFAITSWTEVSKELVINHIKKEFGIENIQYICVSEEISELNHQRHLHIQIILKEKVDRRRPFLDDITGTRCNYQVTRNDLAWNEYIKKEGNYLEFNEFKSIRVRGEKQWPSSSASQSVTTSTSDQPNRQLVPTSTRSSSSSTTTVRAQVEARRQYEQETVIRALKLAEINVHQAMDLVRNALPIKFLAHSTWYLSTFNYVHLRTQEKADRIGQIEKEYIWPLTFPKCTDRLRDAMNRWIRHHFSRTKRAKCLVLIGPTGTGKTSFALSLPGRVNYFKERWNLDQWSNYARYSVYDDIPWDDFSKLNYPNKKSLLTQNGKMNATDKYRNTKEINVQQPAIVLLNPEDAGTLLTEPVTRKEQQTAMYWKQRAFIYIMEEDEYFYQRSQTHHQAATTDKHLSGSSSMGSNDARLGELDEFDQMIERYRQKQP